MNAVNRIEIYSVTGTSSLDCRPNNDILKCRLLPHLTCAEAIKEGSQTHLKESSLSSDKSVYYEKAIDQLIRD